MQNIICDIDGTVADISHRLGCIRNVRNDPDWKADWGMFHKLCPLDIPKYNVIEVVQRVRRASHISTSGNNALKLYFLSSRSDIVRAETIAWLDRRIDLGLRGSHDHDEYFEECLHMRVEGDYRPDVEIKKEMAARCRLTPDNTLCVFDDRQVVVDMWRREGFQVMQVDAWKE